MRMALCATPFSKCALLALSIWGCAPDPSPQLASQDIRLARALVGGWVREGDDCAGDAGVVYAADGTFAAYDVSGTWSLRRNRLTTVILERGEPDELAVRLPQPERQVSTIVSTSNNRLIERWSDGSIHTFARCR